MNSELNELIRFIKEGGIINLIGATVLIVIIISSIARGVSALITNTTQILRKKRFIAILLLAIFCGAISANFLYENTTKVKPEFSKTNVRELVIKPSFYINWNFDKTVVPKGMELTYILVAYNQDGNKIKSYPTPVENYILEGLSGKMQLQVKALLNNEEFRSSKKIFTEYYPNTIEKIGATGQLNVAVFKDTDEEVFCFKKRNKNGEWEYAGFDIELINLIAKKLESYFSKPLININFKHLKWKDILSSPREANYDIAIASISITKKREEKHRILFSIPYLETELSVIGSQDFIKGLRPETVNEFTFAAHKGTTTEDFIKRSFLNYIPPDGEEFLFVDNNEKLFSMIKNNEVDFIIYDYVRGNKVVNDNSDLEQVKLSEKGFNVGKEHYGIAVSNIDGELLELINKILEQSKTEIHDLKRKYDLILNP